MVRDTTVSIVVCTYNRRKMLDECLESLLNQSYPKDKYEVIIIDSSEDLTDNLKRNYVKRASIHGIRLKYFYQKPSGLASARNLGIKKADGEIVCFTDDDCLADHRWIEKLVEGFDNEKVGGCGGRIAPYKTNKTSIFEKYSENLMNQEFMINNKNFIIGNNCCYRRNILQDVEGFDTHFKYGADDYDLGIRVKSKGFNLKYVPEAIVYHRHRTTPQSFFKQQVGYGRGLAILCKKYPKMFPWKYFLFSFSFRIVKFAVLSIVSLIILNIEGLKLNLVELITSLANLIGLVGGIKSVRYKGRKIEDEFDFIKKYSIKSTLIKKIYLLKKIKFF